jgi:hypothetical protein
MSPADPYYEDYNDFAVTHQPWPNLHQKLLGPNAEQVVQVLREYMASWMECIQLDNAFVDLKEEWGQAGVPNTDTVRTYAYYAEHDQLEAKLWYAELTQNLKLEELEELVDA